MAAGVAKEQGAAPVFASHTRENIKYKLLSCSWAYQRGLAAYSHDLCDNSPLLMLRLCNTSPVRLPAHRGLSSLAPSRAFHSSAHTARGSSTRPGAAVAQQGLWSNNRRQVLLAGVLGLGISMLGRSSTALAASRVEQVSLRAILCRNDVCYSACGPSSQMVFCGDMSSTTIPILCPGITILRLECITIIWLNKNSSCYTMTPILQGCTAGAGGCAVACGVPLFGRRLPAL